MQKYKTSRRVCDELLNITPKPLIHEGKKKDLINWAVLKFKTPALWETTVKRRERKATDWEEIFVKHISNKGLASNYTKSS